MTLPKYPLWQIVLKFPIALSANLISNLWAELNRVLIPNTLQVSLPLVFNLISIYLDIYSMLQGAPLPVAPVAVCWWLTGDPALVPVSADAPGL